MITTLAIDPILLHNFVSLRTKKPGAIKSPSSQTNPLVHSRGLMSVQGTIGEKFELTNNVNSIEDNNTVSQSRPFLTQENGPSSGTLKLRPVKVNL